MTQNVFWILLVWETVLNLFAWVVYALDKHYSKKQGHRRIAERTLLLWAFLGGALGAWFSMRLFHHKTRHKRFKILVPLFALLQLGLLILLY